MKRLTFISGALAFSLSAMGMLFKVLHQPGAAVMLAVGIGIFSLLFVPSSTKYIYDKQK